MQLSKVIANCIATFYNPELSNPALDLLTPPACETKETPVVPTNASLVEKEAHPLNKEKWCQPTS